MGTRLVSWRTLVLAAVGLVSAMVTLWVLASATLSEATASVLGNVPQTLVEVAAAAVVIWVALQFPSRTALRRQWLLVGVGVASYAVGDVVWSYYEVVLGTEAPYPGAPDAFYLASYVFLAAGLWMALLSFRKVTSLRTPLLIAGGVSVVITIAASRLVFAGLVSDASVSWGERLLGIAYPIGDVWLEMLPALALALALTRMGSGLLARPWWFVVAGVAGLAIADIAYTVVSSSDAYVSGSLLDAGWWVGFVLIATGASLAVDVQRPVVIAKRPVSRAEAVTS